MSKFRDTKFEDWKAPWEAEGQELDPERVKRLVYDLRVDRETMQDRVTAITQERDQLKDEVDSKKREGESELDAARREKAELQKRLEQAGQASVETLKLRAALKVGLGEEHVKRLVGTTAEELEADAKSLKESFGATGKSEEKEPPRGRPRPRTTPGDPVDHDDPDIDVDKALDQIPRYSLI